MTTNSVVSLRPASLSDRKDIFRALARSELTDVLLGHPSWNHTPLLSFEEFCADYAPYYFTGSKPRLGRCFVILVDEKPVGQINHNEIEPETGWTELDIWMYQANGCGHGIGSQAINELCAQLETEFAVKGFIIKPSAANPRAIRAYQKAGFLKTQFALQEAERRYGPRDPFDCIYMTRNIEQIAAGDV